MPNYSPKMPLTPRDYVLLGKLFEGKSVKLIASELGLEPNTVRDLTARPQFQAELTWLKEAILNRIAEGEFGILALAKTEATAAFRRVCNLAVESKNDKVRLDANRYILEIAGIQPTKPEVVQHVDRLIDDMTAEEANHFIATGEFPERMAKQLARVASHRLQEKDPANAPPVIEGPDEGGLNGI